ncbi:MAG: PAS domain-containing protein [Thermodesulfobacteriota bacterium]
MKPNPLDEMARLALDSLDLAVSIIDPNGTLLYYNRHSAEILNRKPEYIGTDIHGHHQKAANEKLDRMLRDFSHGRTEPFQYEARPYGKAISVTISPLLKEGVLIGCVQTVRLKIETGADNQ